MVTGSAKHWVISAGSWNAVQAGRVDGICSNLLQSCGVQTRLSHTGLDSLFRSVWGAFCSYDSVQKQSKNVW